jgi:hypothetical protein
MDAGVAEWSWQQEEAARRAELEQDIDRHTRLMGLAEHNGFEIVTRPHPCVSGARLWYVPRELVAIVGCMAAVVR